MGCELSGNETTDYCRSIETYLCRKNDGHLIRVVGPSFDLVAGWETQGMPLNVAYSGIDRCFERHARKGPRRRPMKIDFCEADVLDAFDEWRRAVGLPQDIDQPASDDLADQDRPRRGSLPAHLERVVMRLTAARADGRQSNAIAASRTIFDQLLWSTSTCLRKSAGVPGRGSKPLVRKRCWKAGNFTTCCNASAIRVTTASPAREEANIPIQLVHS